MPSTWLCTFLPLALLGANVLSAQSSCGSVQLQLTSDYSYAIGSSTGGTAWSLAEGSQTLAQGSLTQLALFHYDGSLGSTSAIAPSKSSGASTVAGKWGSALAIATGGNLTYPAAGHIGFTDGTIELWIAPTKDGTDPIYAQYDHTLFRYIASNGDQLVFAESANGGFYGGAIISSVYTGAGGIKVANLKAGVWHHVALTYSKTAGRIRMYLDGVQTGEKDAAFSMPPNTGASFTIDSDSSGRASAFLVDELRISADEKSAAQILYDATRSTPFADNEVFLPLSGVAPGSLTYTVGSCGAASYTYTGVPIANLSPPSNLLAPGSTSVALSFNTLQATSCGYSVGTQVPLSSMHPFTGGQGTTQHQGAVSGISSSPLALNTVYLACDSNPDYVQTLQYRVVGGRTGSFPRIGSIWQGEYILSTKPDQAAKIQIYFGPGGMTASQAVALRAQNPNVLILPSVNAQETTGGSPVVPSSYLLHDVNGNAISDWPGNYLLNMTKPEVAAFLAQYAFQQYFTTANLAFDGLFWDNFNTSIQQPYYDYQGVAHQIDADGDGVADVSTALNAAWSAGIYTLIDTFDKLAPNAYVAAHNAHAIPADFATFNGAAFTEDAPHVREGTQSFSSMFNNYNSWFGSGRQPAVSTIQSAPPSQIAYGYGYQPLQNVTSGLAQFAQTYYPNMRFGLATALMNDGFSLFDFGDSGAPVNWWYDEFDFNLGQPTGPNAPMSGGSTGTSPLNNGSFETNLSGWSLLVNNDGQASATAARDAAIAADGSASAMIHVAKPGTIQWHVDFEQNGISLKAGTNYQVQFWARADAARSITVSTQGGAPNYPNYGLSTSVSLTTTWQFYTATFLAPATAADGRLQFFVGDLAGSVWLDGVSLIPVQVGVYRRDYTNGIVLLNGTGARQTASVDAGFTRYSGTQAPLWQYIVDDAGSNFTADSSWQTVTYDTGQYQGGSGKYTPPFYHAWNSTAHLQNAAGTAAQWNLDIPADGQYTIQVWLPAAPTAGTWTKSAVYEVVSGGAAVATFTLDQSVATAGDGWHTVATVNLTAAAAPFLRVHNGGGGPLLADAVYVTSAALFNDGSAVSQVPLGPYDGILLKRQTPVATPASRVNSVFNAASYLPTIASGGFVSIAGTGFGSTTRSWTTADFTASNLPQALSGISVTIDGVPAYVEYVSPTQINVLAPDDAVIGPVTVNVQTQQGSSYQATVVKQKLSPAFFTYPSGTTTYAAAVHLDGTLVGPAGPSSRPAVPGEVIEIYGTGFGATTPAVSTGQLVPQAAPLLLPATVTIGGVNATVQWAGLVSSGLYQLNVQIPNVAAGDQAVQATIGGFQSQVKVYVPVAGN